MKLELVSCLLMFVYILGLQEKGGSKRQIEESRQRDPSRKFGNERKRV